MVEVRDATGADVEEIVRLTASGWRAAYRGIVPAERIENLPVSGWRHDIAAGLRSPVADSFTRIAEIEGAPVGYCFVAAPGREEPPGSRIAELVAIYVDPARWRGGIGRALMAGATAEANRAGYGEMTLWSFEKNAPALAFYAGLGWERDGARRPHAATGVPTIRLRTRLGQAE